MTVEMKDGELKLTRPNDLKENRALHGLTGFNSKYGSEGVSEGLQKTLDIVGVGYKVELKGENLLLNIGYSHPIYFIPPKELKLEVPTPTQIIISGIDKAIGGTSCSKNQIF